MRVVLDKDATMPTKAHDTDAGFDLYATKDVIIPGKWHGICDTGVHIEIPVGYVGMIKSKSGLNVKKHLTAEGVIDCGYTGSIVVKLYNHGWLPKRIKRGEKITQIVIMPIHPSNDLEWVDKLTDTARGNGGFGSSGK